MENLLSKSPKKETVGSIEIMRAQEVVRKDNARLLHDTTAQDLTNLVLCVEIAIRLFDVDPARAKEALHRVREAAIACNSALRFSRSQLN